MVDHLFADAELAALYDSFCPREEREDFRFYLPIVMEASSVLDVGCGTGALLHWARELGHRGRLCGLDPAPGMIEQAKRRPGVKWLFGDLGSFKWERDFDLVVMTGHVLQVFVDDQGLRDTLSAVRTALRERGRFAFETRNPLAREWERWRPDLMETAIDQAGTVLTMRREVEQPVEGDLVRFMHTFTSSRWDGPRTSTSTLRFLGRDPLNRFLAEAGFRVERQYGDWSGEPLTDSSPEIVTIAVAA